MRHAWAVLGAAILLSACAATPPPENTAAVAKHVARMNAMTTALTPVAAVDPTGRTGAAAAPLIAKAQQKSHDMMVDESLSSVPKDERDLMKQRMKGQITEEEFKKQLFQKYGLDNNGNPLPPPQ